MRVSRVVLIVSTIVVVLLAGVIYRDQIFPSDQAPSPIHAKPSLTGQGAVSGNPGAAVPELRREPGRVDEEARPAWMNEGQPATAPAAPSAVKEMNARMTQMRGVMTRLEKLQGQTNPDLRELDATLADLERIHGSSQMHGLRLDVLRENLKVAARMQKASEELQVLQQRQSTGGATPVQQAELTKKVAEIQAMQAELQKDLYVGNAAAKGQ